MNLGVNSFGCSKELYNDFEGSIARIKEIGFASVEPCIVFNGAMASDRSKDEEMKQKMGILSGGIWLETEAAEKLQIVKEHGLEVEGIHIIGLEHIPNAMKLMIENIKKFLKKNNMKYMVISNHKATREEIDQWIPEVNFAAAELKKEGLHLLFHNHDNDLKSCGDMSIIDYYLEKCPDLMVQVDLGWVKFAGVDTVEFLKKHRGRILSFHFKDIRHDASLETKETCFTPIGEGSIPLNEIMEESKHHDLKYGFVIDQDNSIGNILDDLAIGKRNIEKAFE